MKYFPHISWYVLGISLDSYVHLTKHPCDDLSENEKDQTMLFEDPLLGGSRSYNLSFFDFLFRRKKYKKDRERCEHKLNSFFIDFVSKCTENNYMIENFRPEDGGLFN